MSDLENDETHGVVIGVLFGVILFVIALVCSLAVWKLNHDAAAKASGAATEAAIVIPTLQTPVIIQEEAEIVPVGEPLVKVYFAVGQSTLEPAERTSLNVVFNQLVAHPQAIVLLSGFHDASGDPVKNVALAKARALFVRDALVLAGVPADRIKLRKPESTVGGEHAAESRRVEIRVQ